MVDDSARDNDIAQDTASAAGSSLDDAERAGRSEIGGAYTVLARKHRPQNFDALIGQDALVRILSNAFARDRIAHAFMLTGVRGVGKTTTARIIAKGLNCLSVDKPTMAPCGVCSACVAIAESRHVDVLEMDAASRTGIDDIREIIESVRYRASEARYKVYIIDEVHMLSKSAFNGLLKTLEEPPPHVKFILATTDIHKVPATVLSRCMRFDLRRVDAETLVTHLQSVCAAEGVDASPGALAVIARVAEGSVRDALSLLDQAISHGAGAADEAAVREMLGLAERGRLYELFEQIMRGQAAEALATLNDLYIVGGDPVSILREIAEICHAVSVAKVAPRSEDDPTVPPAEREAAARLAEALPVRALSRAWQMLLKGVEEASRAPSALAAAEMVVIRMTHVADLPSPEELIKRLNDGGGGGAARADAAPAGGGARGAQASGPQASGRGLTQASPLERAAEAALARTAKAVGGQAQAVVGPAVSAPMGAAPSTALEADLDAAFAPTPAATTTLSSTTRPAPSTRDPGPESLAAPVDAPPAAISEAAPEEWLDHRPGYAPDDAPDHAYDRSPDRSPDHPPEPRPALVDDPQPRRNETPPRRPTARIEGPNDFEGLIALIRARRDGKLLVDVESFVRPGPMRPGAFEFTPTADAPSSLAAALAEKLLEWTGTRWIVSVSDSHTTPTIAETRRAAEDDLRAQAAAHPLVRAALDAFPGATLSRVVDLTDAAADAPAEFDGDILLDDDDLEDPFGLDY